MERAERLCPTGLTALEGSVFILVPGPDPGHPAGSGKVQGFSGVHPDALGSEGYAADCGLFILPKAWHAGEPVRVPVDGCSIIRRQAKELVCRAPEKEPKVAVIHLEAP